MRVFVNAAIKMVSRCRKELQPVLSKSDEERVRVCPDCGKSMVKNGLYRRTVLFAGHDGWIILLQKLLCTACGITVRIMPSFLDSYKLYPLPIIQDLLNGKHYYDVTPFSGTRCTKQQLEILMGPHVEGNKAALRPADTRPAFLRHANEPSVSLRLPFFERIASSGSAIPLTKATDGDTVLITGDDAPDGAEGPSSSTCRRWEREFSRTVPGLECQLKECLNKTVHSTYAGFSLGTLSLVRFFTDITGDWLLNLLSLHRGLGLKHGEQFIEAPEMNIMHRLTPGITSISS